MHLSIQVYDNEHYLLPWVCNFDVDEKLYLLGLLVITIHGENRLVEVI